MRLIDADALKNMRFSCGMHDDDYVVYAPIREVMKNIDKAPTVNGWISVKDRLPDKNGQYLCWFGKNIVAKGMAIVTYLEMWQAFGSLESLENYPNVTHWMPLPEPPEEEK